jgi:hypothetical protein
MIAKGSPTVMIGALSAARIGDLTTHGGVIVMGFPTVIIGEVGSCGGFGAAAPSGAAAPAVTTQANATRKPTAAEIAEIQAALDANQRQRAINLAIRYYGIDTSNVPNGVTYDPTESNYGVTDFNGDVRLGPAAMASPAMLASTIVHETTHSNQAAALRASDPSLTGWPSGNDSVNTDEAMAYDAELRSANNTGLDHDQSEYNLAAQRRAEHYGQMSPAARQNYDNGGYPP